MNTKLAFFATTFLATTSIACGQSVNDQNAAAATQSYLRSQAQQQLATAQRDQAWRSAKKITLLAKEDWPTDPKSTASISDIEAGKPQKIENERLEVLGIVDDQSCLLKTRNREIVWLEKYATKGLADGDDVRVLGYVVAHGTKQYETAIGSTKTVRVIQLLPLEQHAAEDAKREAAIQAKARQEELQQYPLWTLKNGSSFNARFEGGQGVNARMIAIDSQELLLVKISDFADADAAKIRQAISSQKDAERAAAKAKRR
jgi:hypothetical protein